MKRVLLVLGLLGVVAAWPATSGAATFKGVVVAKERGRLLVASPSGVVSAVSGRAALGSRVSVSGGRALVVGRSRTAHLHGVVIRRVGTTMYLSSNTHVVAVHGVRGLASAGNAPGTTSGVQAGDVVSTDVSVNAGGLDEESSDDVGHTSSTAIQATIASIGTGTVTLTVNGQSLTVPLPVGLTLPSTAVGQTVTLNLRFDQGQSDQSQSGDDDQGDDDSGGGD